MTITAKKPSEYEELFIYVIEIVKYILYIS